MGSIKPEKPNQIRDMSNDRQKRVNLSLRAMENSANELADFLDNERNRRRTVEIVVGQGVEKRCLTMNVDDIPNDDSIMRFDSKGSLCSGESGRSSPAVRDESDRITSSVDTQAT